MDARQTTKKKSGNFEFVNIDLTDSSFPYPITSQGFIDKGRKVYDLSYLDVNANEKGKGLGRKALLKLREMFDEINVYGTEPQAIKFWVKMYEEHLVDSIHWDFRGLPRTALNMYNRAVNG